MRGWMLRLGLSLIVTIGVCQDRLPAQPPAVEPIPYPAAPQVLVVPATPYEPAYHPRVGMAIAPRTEPAPAAHFAQRMLNSHGIGCEANRYGSCGNFWADFRFIFGSCRDFFGDPCVPNQGHGGKQCGR